MYVYVTLQYCCALLYTVYVIMFKATWVVCEVAKETRGGGGGDCLSNLFDMLSVLEHNKIPGKAKSKMEKTWKW